MTGVVSRCAWVSLSLSACVGVCVCVWVRACVCVCVCVCACVCVFVCLRARARLRVCMCVSVSVFLFSFFYPSSLCCTSVRMCVCASVCMCVRVYVFYCFLSIILSFCNVLLLYKYRWNNSTKPADQNIWYHSTFSGKLASSFGVLVTQWTPKMFRAYIPTNEWWSNSH